MSLADIATLNQLLPWFLPVCVTILGACVGSFLNVCIYRIPAGKSVVRPGSTCACGQPIRWWNNIPVLSWFILRGKASCCGRPYSFRYPAVELLTAVLFLASWLLLPPAKAACGWLLISCLICASFIDLDHFEIPDVFSIGLALVGVAISFAVPALHNQSHELFIVASLRSGVVGMQGMLVGSAMILWVAIVADKLLKKDTIGFGDVKFVGAIGAFCGWQGAVSAIFGGALVGSLWFVCVKIWELFSGKKLVLKTPDPTADGKTTDLALGAYVPYGPMLAIGGLAHFLYFAPAVNAYFAQIAALL